MINGDAATRVLAALQSAAGIASAGLPRVGDRLDLRSLIAPDPKLVRRVSGPFGVLGEMKELSAFENVRWASLDFFGSRLRSFRFTNCRLENLVLDACDCRDWRLWATNVEATSFRRTNLVGAVLGPVHNGLRNSFKSVNFDDADLRETVFTSADFVDCSFRRTRLDGVEFGGSRFVNCVFEGELKDVMFAARGFGAETAPPNEMINVDFSHAKFRSVDFHHLDLTNVVWPKGQDHIVVNDLPRVLDFLISHFRGKTTDHARGFVGLFEHQKRWLGANQRTGVLSRIEVFDYGGETAWVELQAALDQFKQDKQESSA